VFVASLGQSSLPILVAQSDKRHANRTFLCWIGMTDTEHMVHTRESIIHQEIMSSFGMTTVR